MDVDFPVWSSVIGYPFHVSVLYQGFRYVFLLNRLKSIGRVETAIGMK